MFKIKTDTYYLSFVDKLKLSNIFLDYSGRIGTGEMRRVGMKTEDFDFSIDLYVKIANSKNPNIFKHKVRQFRKHFKSISYGYNI